MDKKRLERAAFLFFSCLAANAAINLHCIEKPAIPSHPLQSFYFMLINF